MPNLRSILLAAAGILLLIPSSIQAQNGNFTAEELEKLKETAPRVFVDCNRCDRDFFRDEITYVNYVRDKEVADVHVLITEQSTGSGGREYTFAFIGLREFEGMDFTQTYFSGPSDTRDETRRGQVDVLKRGLFPYLLDSPICSLIELDFKQRKMKPTSMDDPWKYWVFSISADSRLDGESSRSSLSLDGNFSASKVTPDWKIRLGASAEYDERKYTYYDDDEMRDVTNTSTQDERDITAMAVKSINEHWSIGGWAEVESSTYSNLNYELSLAPAIEYNYFPYSQSTRRQLRFLYRAGINRADYLEETIYDKVSETLFTQSLSISLSVREPWGNISTTVEGSHYFHDTSFYRVEISGMIDIRLFKGLSFDIYGRYERIHDQLSLPKGDASLDEVLLRRRELATNYDYRVSVGLRYTFGSVFSNVVNPRFGSTRSRGSGGFFR